MLKGSRKYHHSVPRWFFIIEFSIFCLFYFSPFLFSSLSFILRFLSIEPSSIFLSSFSSTSATRGLGSSLAHFIVNIQFPSRVWFVIASFANSAIHLWAYLMKAQPLWGRMLMSSTSPQTVKCLNNTSYIWVTPVSVPGKRYQLTQRALVSFAKLPIPFMSSLKLLNLDRPKTSLVWSMHSQSSMQGTLWQYLQLTPLEQHPLAKKRQQQAAPFSLKRSAAVQPTSSSGLHLVKAASLSFSSLEQMYLLNQKLYSSSPYLQVQLLAKEVSTCFLAGLSWVQVKVRYFFFSFFTNSLGMCLQMLSLGSEAVLKEARYVCTLSWSSRGSCQRDSLVSVLKQQFFFCSSSQKIWKGSMSSFISLVFIPLIKYISFQMRITSITEICWLEGWITRD